MKLYYTVILLIFSVLGISAQEIVVTEFKHLPDDMTARMPDTERLDQNGERCALIRVQTTEKNFHFDVGMVYKEVDQDHVGEIWVYVGNGAKRITIQHQQLGSLNDYDFGTNLKKGETYRMILKTGRVEQVVHQDIRSQFLLFNVEPKDALLYVGDEVWPVDNGQTQRLVPFGIYNYRVEAADYHSEVGRVEVNDLENTHMVNVSLRPAFGWVEVSGDGVLNGADVYIDGQRVGKAPIRTGRLSSGNHRVKIIKPLYKEFETEVTVTDNSVLPLQPQLEPNYADITIAAGTGVAIFLNNERKGTGSWSGRLETGQYKIKAQRASHRPVEQLLVVSPDMPEKNIRIEPLKPIVGNLTVTTTPAQAAIYLDGKHVGETPRLLRDVLIGSHSLTIKKEGYADVNATVEVAEGEMKELDYSLSQRCTITVDVNDTHMGSVSGGGSYTIGEKVNICAKTKTGYEFVSWSDGNTEICRKIVVEEDTHISAQFKKTHTTKQIKSGHRASYYSTSIDWSSLFQAGVGIEYGMWNAMQFYIPVELRIGSYEDLFNVLIGESFGFETGSTGSSALNIMKLTQFMTTLTLRFNFGEDSRWFTSLGGSFNVNMGARVKDAVLYIDDDYWEEKISFKAPFLANKYNFSSRLSLGYCRAILDFSFYLQYDITPKYDISRFGNIYVQDGTSNIHVDLTSNDDIMKQAKDRFSVGMSLKFFFPEL